MLQLLPLRRILFWSTMLLMVSGGCASVTNTSMKPTESGGPVQLSPNLQPLEGPGYSQNVRRPGIPVYGYRPRVRSIPEPTFPQPSATPQPVFRQPAPAEQNYPQLGTPELEPQISDLGEGDQQPTGPLLTPAEPPASLPLVLTVTAGERAQVGNGMTFDIVARNPNSFALENATIEAEFDEALVFPGSEEKRIRRGLGTLAAGESRELAVMLSSNTSGKHCCRFEIAADGIEPVRQKVCVEYIDNDLEISILGPAERTVGTRAEFTIKLLNRAAYDLTDVGLAITHDPALDPREGSAGARFDKQQLSWKLDNLQPGEFVQVQVEFECTAPIDSSCVRADVTCSELPSQRKAQCLQVNEVVGPLQVELRDTRDPLVVDETTEHILTITNRSTQTVGGLGLVARIPAQLDVRTAAVEIDGRKIDIAPEIDVDRVVFNQIGELASGAVLKVRLESRALQAGDANVAFRVMYGDGDDMMLVSEPMTVNAR